MCKAFSCIVGSDKKVTWKLGMDSHTDLLQRAGYRDQTADPKEMLFARVEITPDNNDYLAPDAWTLKVDEAIRPAWWSAEYETLAHAAHKKWLRALDKLIVRQPIVHPFKIVPPKEITKRHITLLRQWDSVWDSVWASVGASVWASVGASVWASVGASVWASVRDSVWASVWDSVWASVWDSVWASVWAYTGSFFTLPKWQHVEHKGGEYPFASCVKLWRLGLVPSFDGTTWRLHGGPLGKELFSITAEKLREGKLRL